MAAQSTSSSSKPSQRSRGWCFTINNYTYEDLIDIETMDCQYMVYGKEIAPTTGTWHVQGYVYWSTLKSFAQVKRALPDGAHITLARGTAQQNKDYCTKEDTNFHERGDMPAAPQSGGQAANQQRWQAAWEAAEAGRTGEIPADIRLRYHSTLKRVREEALLEAGKRPQTEAQMEWFYGPSGTGKSRKAREENPEAYLKMCNKWWDGYSGQKTVIIEDFDLAHKVLCHHLKIWADRYSFRAEVKGGSMEIRPEKLIITSNYHPRDIWTDPRDLEPILRRFKVFKFAELGLAPEAEAEAERASGSGGGGLAPGFHLPVDRGDY